MKIFLVINFIKIILKATVRNPNAENHTVLVFKTGLPVRNFASVLIVAIKTNQPSLKVPYQMTIFKAKILNQLKFLNYHSVKKINYKKNNFANV